MSKHGIKIALCLGLAGMALFGGDAKAMTAQECGALPGNQFLAAIERGTCRIDIQTAAGPDATVSENTSDGGHNGRGERGGGGNGGGGGGNRGGGRDNGGGGGDNGGGNNGGGRSTSGPAGTKP